MIRNKFTTIFMTANQVKRSRKKLEMSQHDLAKASRVSRFKIAMYEVKKGNLKFEEKLKIVNALTRKAYRVEKKARSLHLK